MMAKHEHEEYLVQAYLIDEKSLADIAKELGCSRQYVHKLLKQLGIGRRSLAEARAHAISQGKLSYTTKAGSRVELRPMVVNLDFFKNWSPEMAYVLGVIATDGCLSPGFKTDPNAKTTSSIDRLVIGQQEPELLLKVASLMGHDGRLTKQNKLSILSICSNEIYRDLINLGLTPNKSLTLRFPSMPEDCVRHFIRGCWDGDGSIYLDKGKTKASFVSGSKDFAESIMNALADLGMPTVTLHMSMRKNPSYYFRYCTIAQCNRLYSIFYKDVASEMRLERKYTLLKNALPFYLTNTVK